MDIERFRRVVARTRRKALDQIRDGPIAGRTLEAEDVGSTPDSRRSKLRRLRRLGGWTLLRGLMLVFRLALLARRLDRSHFADNEGGDSRPTTALTARRAQARSAARTT